MSKATRKQVPTMSKITSEQLMDMMELDPERKKRDTVQVALLASCGAGTVITQHAIVKRKGAEDRQAYLQLAVTLMVMFLAMKEIINDELVPMLEAIVEHPDFVYGGLTGEEIVNRLVRLYKVSLDDDSLEGDDV